MRNLIYIMIALLLFSCKKENLKKIEEELQEQVLSEKTAYKVEDTDLEKELMKQFAVEDDMWEQKLERYNSTYQYALVSRAWNVGLETFLYTFKDGIVTDSLQVESQFDHDQGSAVQEFKEYNLDDKIGRVEVRDIRWTVPDSLVKDGRLISKADSIDWEMEKDTVTNVYFMKYGELQLVEKKMPEDWHAELYCDTILLKGKQFIGCHNSETNFYLLNAKKDTVYKHPKWIRDVEYTDFNLDGVIDILFHYQSHVGGLADLAFFHEISGSLKLVDDLKKYPSAQNIEGTKLYFSYHKSGCADTIWDSDLFLFDGYKTIKKGNIHGIGCDGDWEKGIFIYKMNGDKKELVQKISGDPSSFYSDKWEFIEEYWTKNHQRFK